MPNRFRQPSPFDTRLTALLRVRRKWDTLLLRVKRPKGTALLREESVAGATVPQVKQVAGKAAYPSSPNSPAAFSQRIARLSASLKPGVSMIRSTALSVQGKG